MRHLEPVSLEAGAAVFKQGDAADSLYFVEQGELAVVLEVPGAGRVPVRRFGAGQCIGEMALYRSETRAASVEALSAARLWRLSAAELQRIEREEPAMAVAMHRHVAALLAERVSYSNVELKEPLARLAHAIRGLAASRFGESDWDRAAVAAAAQRTDEVGATASALEFLVGRLHSYIAELKAATAAREAIESELRIAGEIQASFLPRLGDANGGVGLGGAGGCGGAGTGEGENAGAAGRSRIRFFATMKPAREAGGDLYDGFWLPDGRFLAVVGDVSGKGVSAALFMAVTATGVRALASGSREPGELMERVNRLLCERNDTMQFVSVFAAIVDPTSGEFWWTNCGHPPAYVVGPDGAATALDQAKAVPLGVFEEHRFRSHRGVLRPGELLVAYSDGVTEAMDVEQSLFGDARLARCLARIGARPPREIVEGVVAEVVAYAGEAAQADDITVLALGVGDGVRIVDSG